MWIIRKMQALTPKNIFGVVVLCHCVLVKQCTYKNERHKLQQGEQAIVAICSFLGGIITAWISIGVGEILEIIPTEFVLVNGLSFVSIHSKLSL